MYKWNHLYVIYRLANILKIPKATFVYTCRENHAINGEFTSKNHIFCHKVDSTHCADDNSSSRD